MKNNYFPIFIFLLSFIFCTEVKANHAMPAASGWNNYSDSLAASMPKASAVEMVYAVRDGRLDEIQHLKFEIADHSLKQFFPDTSVRKITFEQTKAMILPFMKMIHFVGILDIGGIKKTTHFQLAFEVNDDESIRLRGTKKIKLSDFHNDTLYTADVLNEKEEISLDVNLLLKNDHIVLTL